MPHPIMFRDDDFGLADVRRIALGFPGAHEKISHGRPVFYATKSFAWFGGSSKASGEQVRYPCSILVKPAETERPALEQDPRFFYPMYLGPSGWLGLDLTAAEVDWSEVTELIDTSYRLVVTKKLLKELDERNRGVS
jgi:predicted DNA-binding protein (MmcQ/YjbR family)